MPQKRDPASAALIALRTHLKLSQPRFAATVMESSTTSIGRWETSDPPRGDTLLRIVTIAERVGRPDIADELLRVFMRELRPLVPRTTMKRWAVQHAR